MYLDYKEKIRSIDNTVYKKEERKKEKYPGDNS